MSKYENSPQVKCLQN